MGVLTQAERERLEAHALAQATQNKPSHAIVVALREYCQEHGIDASDGELFLIAELARAHLRVQDSSKPVLDPAGLPPRSLKDRRKRERRQGPRRRAADRRRSGLSALVVAVRRMGQPERRSGRDRRSGSDRRQLIRRRRIRRQDER